jgi:hypothetical protein
VKAALAVTGDGQVFRGWSAGADGVAVGEVIFNTARSLQPNGDAVYEVRSVQSWHQ